MLSKLTDILPIGPLFQKKGLKKYPLFFCVHNNKHHQTTSIHDEKLLSMSRIMSSNNVGTKGAFVMTA
jgi:hypothetical protein